MENQANYYMVIPAKVWNSKINPQAILLYGHISVLSNKNGYCWATNNYFEKALGISEATVTRCLASLETIGVIKRHIVYKEGSKQIAKRLIYITDEHTPIVIDESSPIITGDNTPIITDDQDNSTSLNTIKPNNIKNNNKSLQGSLDSLDAYAEEDQKIISLFEKVEWAFKDKGLVVGNRDNALKLFQIIGNKVADGVLYRLNNDWTWKPTSLEAWLEDEVIDRIKQTTLNS
jgi:hypothetical protein